MERCADRIDGSYDEIIEFYEEIGFFPPVKYFPGVIGGHCVMPNLELLRKFNDSVILQAIETSNRMKSAREERLAKVSI